MCTSDQNSPPPPAGPKVFISYRHRSDAPYARLLGQDLVKEFGAGAVFRDLQRIGGGAKFLPKIYAALEACNTFLILISPGWLEAAGRLHDPADFVRMEIAAALASGVNVIPVLLDGARMPPQKDLPDDIKELTDYQAEEVRDSRWEDDVRNLIAAIRARFGETATKTVLLPPPPTLLERLSGAARGAFGRWWGKAALLALPFAVLLAVMLPRVINPGPPARPTPTPGGTSLPTPTGSAAPAQPTPLTKCLREFLPAERWKSIKYGDPNEHTLVDEKQSKDGTEGVLLLTSDGHEAGVITFHFSSYGKDPAGNDTGDYEVEQVIGTDCHPVEGYSQTSGEDVQTRHQNFDWLEKIPLGERHYDLRISYERDTIVAQFMPKPPDDTRKE